MRIYVDSLVNQKLIYNSFTYKTVVSKGEESGGSFWALSKGWAANIPLSYEARPWLL